MTTLFRDSTAVLRRAINEGIIDPTMRSIAVKSFGKISLFQPLMRQLHDTTRRYRANTAWLGKQNSWMMPETRRYQISDSPDNSPVQLSVAFPWMVELARFSVPTQNIGIIKSFEQFLDLPGTPPAVYSSLVNWGNPFVLLPNRIVWYFRLSPNAAGAPWVNVTGIQANADHLPGRPYTDLPQTSDLWYPTSSPASSNIHLPVPGGFTLRAFLLTPAMNGIRAAVKLSGTVQSELSSEAQMVARASW
jgi:hypothetical protein